MAAALLYVLPKLGVVLLLAVSLLVFGSVLEAILTNQELSRQLVAVVLILALLWFVYMKLADSFAGKAVRSLLKKGGKRTGSGHSH